MPPTKRAKVPLPVGVTPEEVQQFLQKLSTKAYSTDTITKTYSTETCIFRQWECGHNQELRVERSTYKGKTFLSIRKYWRKDEDGEFQPGKGVTFSDEDIDDILEGLRLMQEFLEEETAPKGYNWEKEV